MGCSLVFLSSYAFPIREWSRQIGAELEDGLRENLTKVGDTDAVTCRNAKGPSGVV